MRGVRDNGRGARHFLGQNFPQQGTPQIPADLESRAEEAIRFWTASRRTEMPEGTIVRHELLGVSATV